MSDDRSLKQLKHLGIGSMKKEGDDFGIFQNKLAKEEKLGKFTKEEEGTEECREKYEN